MPKGYGYDKPPKKASGFKMRGFSYPGQSPMKGKRKRAEEAAAQQQRADAMEALQDIEIKGESTNLLEGTNTVYGQMPAPIQKRTPIRDNGQSYTWDFGKTPPTAENVETYEMDSKQIENRPIVTKEPTPYTGFAEKSKSIEPNKGSNVWASVGVAAAEAGAKALVTAGINALTNRKKKPRRVVNAAKNFSQIQITKS